MKNQDFTKEQLLADLQHQLEKKTNECYDLRKNIQSLSQQLRDAERGKSEFLSNVRNEINNPLTSIIGLASHLEKKSQEEHVRKMSAWIHQQAFELEYQLRNIMIAAEIEMGEMKPAGSQINIESFLEEQIDYLKTRTDQCKVNVKLHLKSDGIIFRNDPYLLQTICINLLANAIEYSEPGEEVIIAVWCGKETLYLQIQDFGMGIEPKNQEAVFTRFKQLDSGIQKVHRGQGLGLSIVRALTQILDGKIILDSAVNRGTTVTLQLPSLHSAPAFSTHGNEWIFSEGEQY